MSLSPAVASGPEEGQGVRAEWDVQPAVAAEGPWLLPLSARSPAALQALAQAYQDLLTRQDPATASLRDMCYTASVRRSHHDHRLALVGHSGQELAERLEAFRQWNAHPAVRARSLAVGGPQGLVFGFCGQVRQW